MNRVHEPDVEKPAMPSQVATVSRIPIPGETTQPHSAGRPFTMI